MCLAVSGRILTIHHRPPAAAEPPGAAAANGTAEPDPPAGHPDDSLWRVAEVDFGGVRQLVSLACLPEAQAGDQVLVHVGIALSLVE